MSNERDGGFERIVDELRSLLGQSKEQRAREADASADTASTLSQAEIAELMIGARRVRNQHLGAHLFGEPAWDILLNLYVAHKQGAAFSVSAACTMGDTAPTTGLRWLSVLEEHGLLQRRRDVDDHRRVYVDITPKALDQIEAYMDSFTAWLGTRATLRKA